MNLISLARKLSFGAAAVSICAALSSNAHAITSDSFTYSATKVGYYSISPSDLIHDGFSKSTEGHSNSWFGGTFTSESNSCYNTGVNLPEGSTITALVVWYSGTSGGSVFSYLVRQSLSNGSTENLGSIGATVLLTRSYRLINTTKSVVSNGLYNYMLGVCLPPNGSFSGARITYTYTNAGD